MRVEHNPAVQLTKNTDVSSGSFIFTFHVPPPTRFWPLESNPLESGAHPRKLAPSKNATVTLKNLEGVRTGQFGVIYFKAIN